MLVVVDVVLVECARKERKKENYDFIIIVMI